MSNPQQKPLIQDYAGATDFLLTIGGENVQVAAIPYDGGPPTCQSIGWLDMQIGTPAQDFITEHDANNLYFTLNEVPECSDRKPKEADVIAIRGLALDMDPVAGRDLVAERKRIADLLGVNRPSRLPAPSIIINSGRCNQYIWLFGEPLNVAPGTVNPDAMKAQVKALNQAIRMLFATKADKVDSCVSVEHLYRWPGTINRMNSTTKKGLAPALASHVDTGKRYSLKDFLPLLDRPASPTIEEDSGSDDGGPVEWARKNTDKTRLKRLFAPAFP